MEIASLADTHLRQLKEKVVMIRKGFTLIELLVVIAIIALLMAILMPALQRVKRQAGKAVCQSNLKQMGLVVEMYTNDFDGKFHQESPAGPQYSWVYAMRPYYSHEPEIRNCPLVRHFYSDTGGRGGPFVGWGVYGKDGYSRRLKVTTAAMGGTGGFAMKTASRNIGGILTRFQVTATRSLSSWMPNGWTRCPDLRTSHRVVSSRS